MKKFIFIFMILIITVAALSAQEDIFDLGLLYQLELREQMYEEIEGLQTQAKARIRELNLKQNVLKAQLALLLNKDKTDMPEIKNLIMENVRLRGEIEIITVGVRIRLREMLGRTNWENFVKLQRQDTQPQTSNPRSSSSPGSVSGPKPAPSSGRN